MSNSARLEIGIRVACSDGDCGDLQRIIIDPAARAISHLAVGPRHDHGDGRLVPVALVASVGDEILLRCDKSEFAALLPAQDAELVERTTAAPGYGQDLTMDVYGDGLDGGIRGASGAYRGTSPTGATRTFDRVPAGDVDVHADDQVTATDGSVGRVRGFLADPESYSLTHVLADAGHLWGKKELAIPIAAVNRIERGVAVNLTRAQVGDLALPG